MKVTLVETQPKVTSLRLDELGVGDFFEFVDRPGSVGIIMEGWQGSVKEIVRLTDMKYVTDMADTACGSHLVRRLPPGTQFILEAE